MAAGPLLNHARKLRPQTVVPRYVLSSPPPGVAAHFDVLDLLLRRAKALGQGKL